MNIQFARMSIFNCGRENLRLKPGAAANLAGLAGHERTDAIASELAPSFFIEPLDLGNEPFKRLPLSRGPAVTAGTHLDWLSAAPKVKRVPKSPGQFRTSPRLTALE